MMRRATSTMQVSSSMITVPPEPSIEPILATESKSMATSISSAVSSGQELPPGITAFSFLPPRHAAGNFFDQFAERKPKGSS